MVGRHYRRDLHTEVVDAMTPILFPAGATSFATQGLGALSDAISCTVMEERNGEFELEMQYPQTGVHFADISDRCIITAIPSPWRTAQPFRIYRITKPMNGVCTIYARHITYDLGGIPVNVFSAQNVASALAGLKSNSAAENPFEFWTDKTTTANFAVKTPAALRSRLGGNTGSILDVYGGEYEWDGMTVKLHNNRGTDRGVTIRYGKNLTDIEQDRNIANVRTGIYPYWANSDGVLVVCDPPVVNAPGSYDFVNIDTVDFSQDFEEQPTPAQLKERAEQYISANNIGVPSVSISVSFVDLSQTDQYKGMALLEQCDLCDTVTVQFEALGVNATAEIVRIETDVLLERYKTIEVGSLRTNITDTIVGNNQATNEKIDQTASWLEKQVQEATDQITNGGGYIYRVYDANKNLVEIGSTDNLDLNKAVHVWRWNNGGFGHSGNGYNGHYRTAITQDGHIVADFIDTGTLTANIMRAGILQDVEGKAFYLDLPNGVLRMNATELSISGAPAASQSYAQQQAQAAQQAAIAAAAQSLNDYADTVTASLDDLQQQVDGQITTYFYDYTPTNDNAPANEWTTDEEMRRHAGDLFYNTSNGDAYRWAQYHGTWQWLEIVDTDVAAALAAAAAAQDTADSKRRVFTAQPVPPYDVGDLWAEENNGPLQVCITAKASGAAFAAADWTDAANYTAQAAEAGRNLISNTQLLGVTSSNSWADVSDCTVSYDTTDDSNYHIVHLSATDYALQNLRGKTVTLSHQFKIDREITYGTEHTPAIFTLRVDVEFADGTRQSIYPDYEIQTADANIIATQPTSGWVTKTKIAEIQDKEIESVTLKYIFQYITGAAAFRYAKLEFGEIATPWSPAPEDTAIAAEAPALDQLGTFNKLTNNGQLQGIYMSGGQLYINGSYIRAGTIDASQVNVTNLNANNITTGHLSADYLQGGTIDASKISVTNLNADNIKSGTITGRAISGGTITGTSISGGTIEGAKIISRSNGTSVQVYDSKFFVFGTQGTSRLRIQANGDESGEIDFWTTDGFWAGKIRGYRDGDFGRIEVTMGNNGFFTTNRIQTKEIAVTRDDVNGGLYSDGYRSLNGNYLMRYENGIRQCWLDRLALNGGAMYGLQWVNINGYYALCRV